MAIPNDRLQVDSCFSNGTGTPKVETGGLEPATNAIQDGSGKNVGITAKSDEQFVLLEVRTPRVHRTERTATNHVRSGRSWQKLDQNRTGPGPALFIVSEIVSAHRGTLR